MNGYQSTTGWVPYNTSGGPARIPPIQQVSNVSPTPLGRGQLWTNTGSGITTLDPGSSGLVLSSDGTDLTWVAQEAANINEVSTASGTAGLNTGELWVGGSSAVGKVAAGGAGQILATTATGVDFISDITPNSINTNTITTDGLSVSPNSGNLVMNLSSQLLTQLQIIGDSNNSGEANVPSIYISSDGGSTRSFVGNVDISGNQNQLMIANTSTLLGGIVFSASPSYSTSGGVVTATPGTVAMEIFPNDSTYIRDLTTPSTSTSTLLLANNSTTYTDGASTETNDLNYYRSISLPISFSYNGATGSTTGHITRIGSLVSLTLDYFSIDLTTAGSITFLQSDSSLPGWAQYSGNFYSSNLIGSKNSFTTGFTNYTAYISDSIRLYEAPRADMTADDHKIYGFTVSYHV